MLDADIAKCFDRIDHKALISKIHTYPTLSRLIKQWLKAGYCMQGSLFPTNEGTPQGGVISPLLANIALHGMEERVKQYAETIKGHKTNNRKALSLIRYADDFVIMHENLSVVMKCKEIIAGWLSDMGLELKQHSDTPIVRHIKVKGVASPYDGNWIYWSKRRGEYPETPNRVASLIKKQKGICYHCGLYFSSTDIVEVDHKLPLSLGGKDQYDNLQLLHRHCHDTKTATDGSLHLKESVKTR